MFKKKHCSLLLKSLWYRLFILKIKKHDLKSLWYVASYFKNSTKNDFYYYFFSIFLEEKLKSMAFLYDQTVEELTASTWKKVTIGVLLTLIFHLGDVLLGGRLAKNYKINVSEIGKVNHLPFCFYKMHSPVANAVCLPIRKRIGKWQSLAFAYQQRRRR